MGSVSDASYAKGLDWCRGRKWLDPSGPTMSLYPGPAGQGMAGMQKEEKKSTLAHATNHPLHPLHHHLRVTFTSISSPPPNATAALGESRVMNRNLIQFSFARSSLSQIWISHQIWDGGLQKHISSMTLCMFYCIYNIYRNMHVWKHFCSDFNSNFKKHCFIY